MPEIFEDGFWNLISKDLKLRLVEPYIYTVYDNFDSKSSYDRKFGSLYDRVACNPLYNRIIWGYLTKNYASLTLDALASSKEGWVLDAGCGSLAFTAKTYTQYHERPIVFLDQSLKLIRIAKSRLIKLNGEFPENMVFVQGDALDLPFNQNMFTTVISLNLIHVVGDLKGLLSGIRNVLAENGRISFTTLVKSNNMRDRYLKLWEEKGELISRDIEEICKIFDELGMPVKHDIAGSLASIYYGSESA
ncbi:class I SAM-dependent methyltransferase [Thermodesulfobacteriota bacterium]